MVATHHDARAAGTVFRMITQLPDMRADRVRERLSEQENTLAPSAAAHGPAQAATPQVAARQVITVASIRWRIRSGASSVAIACASGSQLREEEVPSASQQNWLLVRSWRTMVIPPRAVPGLASGGA